MGSTRKPLLELTARSIWCFAVSAKTTYWFPWSSTPTPVDQEPLGPFGPGAERASVVGDNEPALPLATMTFPVPS